MIAFNRVFASFRKAAISSSTQFEILLASFYLSSEVLMVIYYDGMLVELLLHVTDTYVTEAS